LQAAENLEFSAEIREECSVAKASVDVVGSMLGLNPQPPSELNFYASR
jgi:hypothetical protein